MSQDHTLPWQRCPTMDVVVVRSMPRYTSMCVAKALTRVSPKCHKQEDGLIGGLILPRGTNVYLYRAVC